MFLLRRLHKWFGLVLGIQLLLWAISGAVMAMIDHHKVTGGHVLAEVKPSPAPTQVLSLAQVSQAIGAPVSQIELRPLQDQWVFAATTAEGCLLYTSPSPRDRTRSRMPSSA